MSRSQKHTYERTYETDSNKQRGNGFHKDPNVSERSELTSRKIWVVAAEFSNAGNTPNYQWAYRNTQLIPAVRGSWTVENEELFTAHVQT